MFSIEYAIANSKYRRLGIFKSGEGIDELSGREINLTVIYGNKVAIKAYESFGYIKNK